MYIESLSDAPSWLALAPIVAISLGRILGGIGSIAAIPFTGGFSAAALPAIFSGGSEILGGFAEGRQEGRTRAEDQAGLQATLRLRDRELQETQRQARMGERERAEKSALLLSLLSQGNPERSFSLPALAGGRLGPQTVTVPGQPGMAIPPVLVQALMDRVTAGPDTYEPIDVSGLQTRAGFGEKLASGAGLGLGLLGELLEGRQARTLKPEPGRITGTLPSSFRF